MQISLRSHMIAGVAAIGATAIAITPITQPDLLPSVQRATASIELTASVANPLIAIGGVIQDVNTDIFNNAEIGAPWSNPYGLVYNGIIPDIFARAFPFPVTTSVISNLSGYAWAGIRGAGEVGLGLALGVIGAPAALVGAAQVLIGGGTPAQALAVLQAGIVDPIQTGIASGLEAANYIVDNVVYNVGAVLNGIVPAVTGLAGSLIGGTQFIVQKAINTLTTAFGQLSGGQFVDAWNTVVNGFLGRQGTLGYLEQMTLGPGIDAGGGNYIPSPRTVITTALSTLGGDIFNPPYTPVVPVPSAANKAAAPVAATLSEAPATETGDSTPSVTKSATDRGTTGVESSNPAGDNTAGDTSSTEATDNTGGDSTDTASTPKRPAKQKSDSRSASGKSDNGGSKRAAKRASSD